ncbi:uncharacterized protein FTJAE_1530 [Fusarium tjaetaba]|uniref:Uncharacterized protein n=1 Tax=Fusarium tjaetaba TaxID=1567544 RepID=A0A8H5S9L9_9HYPO|nr:uncharacterized protein FTJAE_1530 [Fusarium tjaetaba]KAF5647847.1 hypothetical protein FTJAE_1530 [Fusarium tjaetaba]
MVKRFDGLEFWEQRCRALQLSQTPATKSPTDSEPSLSFESPELSSAEPASPALSLIKWPTTAKPLESVDDCEPIFIQTVSAVHDVRNSMSFSPSLDQHSQSACVLRPSSFEGKEEFLTVISRGGSDVKRDRSMDERKSPSAVLNTTQLRRRSPLRLQTTNLSAMAQRQQRHSMMPNLPAPNTKDSPLDHRHTLSASADCNKCITHQTDKAFEALTQALNNKRQDETKHLTIIRPTIDCRMPSLKAPKPIRPKMLRKKTQEWTETQEDIDSSTASSLSSPISPMMPIQTSLDGKDSGKSDIPPMGCNLDHDLDDFLKWEARNVCAYGYGTNGYTFST